MPVFEQILPLLVLTLLLVAGKVALTFLDHRRIREHLETLGSSVVDISWDPFRRGAPTSAQANDAYRVIFEDRDGVTRTVYCKTSFMGGVYIVGPADGDPLAMNLQQAGLARAEKLRRLRSSGDPPPAP